MEKKSDGKREREEYNRILCVKKATENTKSIKHTQHTFNIQCMEAATGHRQNIVTLTYNKKIFFYIFIFFVFVFFSLIFLTHKHTVDLCFFLYSFIFNKWRKEFSNKNDNRNSFRYWMDFYSAPKSMYSKYWNNLQLKYKQYTCISIQLIMELNIKTT